MNFLPSVRPYDPVSMGMYTGTLGAVLGGGLGAGAGALFGRSGRRGRGALRGAMLGAGIGGLGGFGMGAYDAIDKNVSLSSPIYHGMEGADIPYMRRYDRDYQRDLFQKAQHAPGLSRDQVSMIRKDTPGRFWGTDEGMFTKTPDLPIDGAMGRAGKRYLQDVVGQSSRVPLLDMLRGRTTPEADVHDFIKQRLGANSEWPDEDYARHFADAYTEAH